MPTPSELVTEAFATAQGYASENTAQLATFTAALSATMTTAPTVDVEWAAVAEPSVISAPARPAALEEVEAEFDYDADGTIAAAMPSALAVSAPTIAIDEFSETAPEVDFGDAPVLSFPVAPTVTIDAAPTVPDVEDITVPDAPTIELPDTPSYLALTTPTFAGVDLHADFLTNLEDRPTLSLVAPTPYTFTPSPEYGSALLTALQEVLEARMAGGTGLDATVEAAIWDRARDREQATWQANIDEVTRESEALGYALPAGVTTQRLRQATVNYLDKVAEFGREVAIKQADLEQANLRETITQSLDLEGKLIDSAYRIEALAFESAKVVAQNAVETYNARLQEFGQLVSAYNAYANAYQNIVDGEKLKIEAYRGAIAGEQAKADTNRTLVEQYKAEIEARMTQVRIFEAQIQSAKTLMELEGAKIAAAGEQIKAYVAGINGQTAKVEAYKAQVQAEGAKADAHRADVEARKATVEVYKIKADAFASKVSGQVEEARAQIAYYEGMVRSKASEWDAWRARVQAESERIRAVGMKSQSALDGFRADIVRYEAEVNQDLRHWEASIKQYDAQKNYTLTAEKLNSDIIRSNNEAQREAAKVGAQVWAQLTASSYGLIHANASVSAGATNSVSYSYNNQTTSAPGSITSI